LTLVSETPARIDDGTLVSAARKDDEGAFRTLHERHGAPLLGFLVRLLRDQALAEDVLQEAFFRVYLNLDRCDETRFRAFLYQTARNAALDAIRMRRKAEKIAEGKSREPLAEHEGALESLARKEQATRASEALDTLAPETRALLIQRHAVGMTLEELADSWSVNERTIRTRLRAAASELAAALAALPGGLS